MRGTQRWPLFAAMIVAVIALFGIVAWAGPGTSAQGSQAPSRPAWVGENGVVDLSKVPECFTIVGLDGKQVLDSEGKPLCGKPFDTPVTEPEAEVKSHSVPSGATVPGKRPPGVPPSSGTPSVR